MFRKNDKEENRENIKEDNKTNIEDNEMNSKEKNRGSIRKKNDRYKHYKEYHDPRDEGERMIPKNKVTKMIISTVAITLVVSMVLIPLTGLYGIVPKNRLETYKRYKKLYAVEKLIRRNYYKKPNEEDLVNYSIKGLVAGLKDVYSEYYTVDEMKKIQELTTGSFVGMGAYIGVDEDDGKLMVTKPFKNSPAEKAGIKSGDKILKVGDKVVDYRNMDEAIGLIKGEKGTKVKITIERGPKVMEKTVTRDVIVEQSIESKMYDKKIGYIKITSFIEGTYKDFHNVLESLKAQGMKALIIDVRDNGGGMLDSVESVANDLLGEATIVYTKDGHGKKEYLKSDGKAIGVPIVILTNGNSASASEILTGAIVDNKIGISMGTKTFGKGLVQSVGEFPDGTGYKLTTAQYFTPSGAYINKKGIKPNIEVKDETKQIDSAREYLEKKIEK